MNIIKSENSVKFKSKIDTKDYFYIIMDLCIINLEDYIKSRENEITINEIKEVLIQLNNVFKIMNNKKIIHRDLKPSNILISLDRLDKCLIKLSDYGSSKFINLSNTITNTINGTPLTMAPEILNGDNYNFKSDI
jgi:serine/threonine protein kinase